MENKNMAKNNNVKKPVKKSSEKKVAAYKVNKNDANGAPVTFAQLINRAALTP